MHLQRIGSCPISLDLPLLSTHLKYIASEINFDNSTYNSTHSGQVSFSLAVYSSTTSSSSLEQMSWSLSQ